MKKLVFLTGAGMSVESGFKTFRGNDGLWENYPVEQIATHEGWEADPTLVTNFYNMLRHKLYAAQPNEGHKLIKDLEKDFDVTVITQNVDNLHKKAGSKNVIHLHGELSKVCSSRDPYDYRYIKELPENDCEVEPGTKAGDGSLLRPFIVFFGESRRLRLRLQLQRRARLPRRLVSSSSQRTLRRMVSSLPRAVCSIRFCARVTARLLRLQIR